MKKVEAIFRPDRLEAVAAKLDAAGFNGYTITDARGHGRSAEKTGEWRGVAYEMLVSHKLAMTVIIEDSEVDQVVQAITAGAATGVIGDGLISVTDLAAVYQIRPATATAPAPAP